MSTRTLRLIRRILVVIVWVIVGIVVVNGFVHVIPFSLVPWILLGQAWLVIAQVWIMLEESHRDHMDTLRERQVTLTERLNR